MRDLCRPSHSGSSSPSASPHNNHNIFEHRPGTYARLRLAIRQLSAAFFCAVLLPGPVGFAPSKLGLSGRSSLVYDSSVFQPLAQNDANDSNVNEAPDQSGDAVGGYNSDQPDAQSNENGDLPEAGPTDDSGSVPQGDVNPDEGNDQNYQNPEANQPNPDDQQNDLNPDEQNQQSTPDM